MNRTATALLVLVTLCALTGAAVAGPPLEGVYESTDLGGSVAVGRYTEGWDVPGGALDLGTTLNAESWDGSNLGLEWRYFCSSESAPPLLFADNVDANGNGNRTWLKTFSGGYIWLSGTGPWANGEPDYPGVIDAYFEIETIQYSNWVRVNAITNVQATAHFDGFPETCMNFYIANGVEVGSTDFGHTKPATYPDLLTPDCDPTRTLGGWWDMMTLTLTITGCTTATEESTWGGVKARYLD